MKRKFRVLSLAAVLATVMLMATGCSGGESGGTGSSGGSSSGGSTINLKFGHDNNTDGSYHAGALEFQRLVAEKTGGAVKIDIYPSAQLGDEATLLESVRMGTVDFATCGCSNAATVFPELGLFSVSYLFKDQAHFDKCVADDSPMIDRLKELVADRNAGARIGGLFTIGKRSVINKRGPIVTPDDLKGMKIRVMASPIETEVWTTLGALPTSIATAETYSALESGVVEAAENAPIIVYSWKFHEPAPYYSLTEHQFFLSPVFVSDKVAGKLGEYADTVMEALREAAVYERQADIKINEQALKDLEAGGAKINNNVDKQAFMDKLASLQDKVAGQYNVQDLLEMIRAAA